jgi:hypothetical protein
MGQVDNGKPEEFACTLPDVSQGKWDLTESVIVGDRLETIVSDYVTIDGSQVTLTSGTSEPGLPPRTGAKEIAERALSCSSAILPGAFAGSDSEGPCDGALITVPFPSFTGTAVLDIISDVQVPEPSTELLLTVAQLALLGIRRFSKQVPVQGDTPA